MSLRSVVAQLEDVHRQPWMQERGRFDFERVGQSIIGFGELTAEEAEIASHRLAKLARELPGRLVTSDDWELAIRICRDAADRLTGAPWFRDVVAAWPAPIAHELLTLANALSGAGRPQPSPEAALLQLRDLGETMLKLPASILARRVIARGGDGADALRRALRRVSGGWNEIAREAVKQVGKAESLAGIAALLEGGSPYGRLLARLATARNDHIGHGALRANPADTARIVAWFVAPGRATRRPPARRAGSRPARPSSPP